MPKATVLTSEALVPSLAKPAAATPPRGVRENTPPAEPIQPLQLRLPRSKIKAIKVAAAEGEKTISDLMLACFEAYMKATKHA